MGVNESKAKLEIFSLLEERHTNKQVISDLNDLIVKHQSEISSLKDQVSRFRGLKQRKINRISNELNQLIKEVNIHKRWKSYQVLKILIKKYMECFNFNLESSFYRWKNIQFLTYMAPLQTQQSLTNPPQIKFDCTEAEIFIQRENSELVSSNPLLRICVWQHQENERVMTVKQVLRIFEDVIKAKYTKDSRDIADGFRPHTFPDFFVNFLHERYNTHSSTTKIVIQFITAIEKYSSNSGYISLFCKFLQLKKFEPIGYSFGLYLTKVFNEFTKLIEKRDRKADTGRQGSIKLSLKNAEGGNAFICDVLTLLYSLFPSSTLREQISVLLRPQYLSKEEYLLFCICHMLKLQNITPEGLFERADPKHFEYIQVDDILDAIKEYLEIWIPPEYKIIVYSLLDCLSVSTISKERFLSKVSMKIFESNEYNERYVISKQMFIESIISEYKQVRVRTTAYLIEVFDSNCDRVLEAQTFSRVLKEIEPRIDEEMVEQVFNEGKTKTGDIEGVNRKEFVRSLVSYAIGDRQLKYFCKNYADISGLQPKFKMSETEEFALYERKLSQDIVSITSTDNEESAETYY